MRKFIFYILFKDRKIVETIILKKKIILRIEPSFEYVLNYSLYIEPVKLYKIYNINNWQQYKNIC